MFGADIDAAGRVKAKQCLEPGGNPAGDHHFLLVAAAEPSQFGARAGVDLQTPYRSGDAPALARRTNQAPVRRVANKRQGDVLPDRTLRQEGLKPIRRDQHKAGCDRVAGMMQSEFSAMSRDLTAVMAAHPRNTVEQFLLPLTLERCDTENLPPEGRKRHS